MLLHLVRKIYPNTPALFIDTGLEFPEVRAFALSQENVIVKKPEMNFRKVIETYGYPAISKSEAAKIRKLRHSNLSDRYRNYLLNGDERGKYGMLSKKWQYLITAPFDISEKCCDIMKKKPAKQFERETGLKPYIGTMACESSRRTVKWLSLGCNVFQRSVSSSPLSFWTEQDILQYLLKYDIPYASVYGEIIEKEGELFTTGEKRTGCVFCMFGCHLEKEPNRFQRLKQTHPKLWEYCMKNWDKGGLGERGVLEYINVKIE